MSLASKIKNTEAEIKSIDRKTEALKQNRFQLVESLRRLRSEAALAAAAQKTPFVLCF